MNSLYRMYHLIYVKLHTIVNYACTVCKDKFNSDTEDLML